MKSLAAGCLMSEIRVVVDDTKRAKYIALGAATILALTFLWMQGAFSFLVYLFAPQPADGKLSSAWGIGMDIAGDALYMVGIVAASLASGISSVFMAILNKVTAFASASKTPATPTITKEALDKRSVWILEKVKKEFEAVAKRLDGLEREGVISNVAASTTPARKKAAKKTAPKPKAVE